MGHGQPLRALRRGYFVKCVAVAAIIIMMTSAGGAQSTTEVRPDMPGARDLQNPALLTEFGRLLEKVQHDVEFPPARNQSRLLPFLPESTTFYVAFSNYGDASHHTLRIFQQEVQQSAVLRAWWQQGEMAANGAKVEDALEKFYQLSQYLGDEIVLSGATEGRQDPSLLILAEVRRPGLKDFLQRTAKELAGKSKPAVRVLDVQELAAAVDTRPAPQMTILVRPDVVVAALDVATLRSFNARLERRSREFVSIPFGQRVAQAYEGGATVVGAADLHKILNQIPPSSDQSLAMFQRAGFADMKYVVWQHNNIGGQAVSQMELSFTGPRRGVASWLAAPGPLGSLDFVSPKAVMVASVLLRSPAQIFDEVRDLSTASNPQAFAGLTQMEKAMRLSFKEDLLSRLGGEITVELDSFTPPDPVWKAILRVNDPERLQTTLSTLLGGAPVSPQQPQEGGVTYHTIRIPSAKKILEIGYAFVDGYLVIGSSRATVLEAVRLHRSGESLAKSRNFLASVPPGQSSEASALFYQDPVGMTALRMRQVLPEIAESLSHANAEATPSVMYLYGEESALREVSRSGGVDAGAGLVVAAIAIPNLLRARIAANESSAVGMIRTANTAQIMYSSTYPERGFARDLATLGPDPRGGDIVSAEHASMIDASLGNASCTANTWCTKSGFRFRLTALCKRQKCEEFVVVGTPETRSTGARNFCSTSDGIVRFESGPPLITPVTVSQCLAWPPLQ